MARNKSLHRNKMRGGRWQPSLAKQFGIPEDKRSACSAINYLKATVKNNEVCKVADLVTCLIDDLDKRISAIEDTRPQHLNSQ